MRRLLCGLACLLAAACASLDEGTRDALTVSAIVGASLEAARASPVERERALAGARQAFAANRDEAGRLRLAALLATLPEPQRNEPQAAALLKPYARAAVGSASPLAQFGALLAMQLAERRRQARAGEEREQALRRQLEALKAIERGVQEREERMRTRMR